MKKGTEHIIEVLSRHLAGDPLSASEQAVLEDWAGASAVNRGIFEELRDGKHLEHYLQQALNDKKTESALALFEARHSFVTGKSNSSEPANLQPLPSEPTQSNSSEPTEPRPLSSEPTEPQSVSSEPTNPKSGTSEPTNPRPLSYETNPNQSGPYELTPIQSKSSEQAGTYPVSDKPGALFGRGSVWFRYAAAAVILLLSTATAFLVLSDRQQTPSKKPLAAAPDILPATQRAVLTLADGSTIVLDSAANGRLAEQGGIQILKQANGRIVYSGEGGPGSTAMINTMRTPRGGQYRLTLPDGTNVWLNAASSITYPAEFTGKERGIKISGEVYMEVVKNKKKPFIVNVDGKSSIEVLGTSFNVNSYAEEESIKATLVEGSIKVANVAAPQSDRSPGEAPVLALRPDEKAGWPVILKPGQQAVIDRKSGGQPLVRQAGIEQTLAWKNGLFDLQDLSLQEVARQLERWYDINIIYEGTVREMIFEGKLSRDVKLSAVLNWFSELGIHNRLEGRTLILGRTNN